MEIRELLDKLFHAGIATGIAFATVRAEHEAGLGVWKQVGICAVVFVLFLILAWWHDRRARKLKDAGVVDGYWVDVMRDLSDDKIKGGSLLKITSSGQGFRVEGESFEYGAAGSFARKGGFAGRGQRRDDSSIYFYFRGDHHPGGGHGSGYYEFQDEQNGKAHQIQGAFFDVEAKLARRIRGRRKMMDEFNFNYTPEQKKKIIKEYLDQMLIEDTKQ
jgi:hypothetical protein